MSYNLVHTFKGNSTNFSHLHWFTVLRSASVYEEKKTWIKPLVAPVGVWQMCQCHKFNLQSDLCVNFHVNHKNEHILYMYTVHWWECTFKKYSFQTLQQSFHVPLGNRWQIPLGGFVMSSVVWSWFTYDFPFITKSYMNHRCFMLPSTLVFGYIQIVGFEM